MVEGMCLRAMSTFYKKSVPASMMHSSSPHRGSASLGVSYDDLEWSKNQQGYNPLFQFNIVSFNLLAPVYKRLQTVDITTGFRKRESQKEELWSARAHRTADFFKKEVLGVTDIIGLQEFWLDSAYRNIFEDEFKQSGYDLHVLKRPGKKLDGVALVVKAQDFEVLGTEHVFLSTLGDRVALLLWLKHRESGKDLLVANTHLSFPHSSADRLDQMTQMQNLTTVMDTFARRYNISYATRIVMGDFNVESKSPVCDHLRTVGYASCFEVSPPSNAEIAASCDQAMQTSPISPVNSGKTDASSDSSEILPAVKFISHRNHRAEDLGVDHIFVRPETAVLPTCMSVNDLDRLEDSKDPIAKLYEGIKKSTSVDEFPRCAIPDEYLKSHPLQAPIPLSACAKIFIDDCFVLPKCRRCGLWDENFLISDHRPVGATIIFATPKTIL